MVLIMADPKRRPGRPEIGGRVTIALGPLLARIDAVRGERSRAAWLRAAAKQALTVQADPLGPLCPCCGTPVRLWIDLNKEAQADCSACEWSTPDTGPCPGCDATPGAFCANDCPLLDPMDWREGPL